MKSEKSSITLSEMEFIKEFPHPPLAWMPTEVFFKAEFCGSDNANFIYVKAADTGSVQNYTNLRTVMDKKYAKFGEKSLPQSEIVENSYVVLKEECLFHRAKVTRKDDDLGLIFCLKIDEGTCSVVGSRQIFRISEDLMNIPCCTIRCKLQGMEFFDDLPHLELGYKLIKMSEIMIRSLYSVEVVGIMDDIPYVNLTRYGMGLVNAIQKFIPLLCEPQVPKAEVPFEGEILHANSKACLWILQYGDNGLASKIVDYLKRYKITRDELRQERAAAKKAANSSKSFSNYGGLVETTPVSFTSTLSSSEGGLDPDFFLMPEELWKEKYLEFPTGIFVSEYLGDLYRARLVKYCQKNKVEVEFIDFGNRQVTNPKRLIPIQKIDQNLAFIPPQCIKARLHGFYRMNTFYFWRLLPSSQSLTIVIKDLMGDEERGMEIDIVGKDKPGKEDSDISVSETWRTSSPDLLALCDIKPVEKSTGETVAQNKGQMAKRRQSTVSGRKQRGALYKLDGIAVDQRLRRLLLSSSNSRWH